MAGYRARRPSGNCAICGTWRQSLHREHIIPKWKGGSDDKSNIQWLCANCHEDKTREENKGKPSPMKGRVHSEETRQKMSRSALTRIARDGYNMAPLRGVKNGRAKLTEEQVAEIRERYANGDIGYGTLAKEYGIQKSHVASIIKGRLWKRDE